MNTAASCTLIRNDRETGSARNTPTCNTFITQISSAAVDISGFTEGDRFDCPNCAGLTLELVCREGRFTLPQVHRVSCPLCGQRHEVPEDAKAGDTMTCCDRTFRLTYEFGAYALE